jgi:hypothetical protein
VFGFFKMKALLIGLILASPSVAMLVWRGGASSQQIEPGVRTVAHAVDPLESRPVVRLPVEVLAKGSEPQWVYVEVGTQPIPEPGVLPLLTIPALLLLIRRKRC